MPDHTFSRKRMAAEDERQYMITEDYEIYEKIGEPTGATSLHYHDFYEILYISEGSFDIYVEPSVYHLKKGDLLLIDRNRIHHYLHQPGKHQNNRRILLWITDAMLNRLSQGKLDLHQCFSSKDCAWRIPSISEYPLRDFLQQLVVTESTDTEDQSVRSLTDWSYLTLFFTTLYRFQEQKPYRSIQTSGMADTLVQQVSDYIDTHLNGDLSLDTLADHVHISKYYFLRSFKELTGLTIHQFILQKRLIKACEFMRQNIKPTEAALLCGFADYSSFYRNFKRAYGLSPKDYA